MLDINLKQLEAFVTTVEYCSFTRAAEMLYLTQSTVSAHISTLERILNLRLIQRGARQRVALTKEGEIVYQEAKEILRRCHALRDGGICVEDNQLLLCAPSMPEQYMLPDIMAAFLKERPESRYVLLRGDTAHVHSLLDQGKARLGFVGAVIDRKKYHYHVITENKLVLATANTPAYQAMKEQHISGHELLSCPLILREGTSGTQQAIDAYFKHHHILPESLQVVAKIDSPEAIKSSVSRGLGVSILSNLAVQEEATSGKLLIFDLETEGAYQKIYLCWRKDTVTTPLEQAFISFVRSNTASGSDSARSSR